MEREESPHIPNETVASIARGRHVAETQASEEKQVELPHTPEEITEDAWRAFLTLPDVREQADRTDVPSIEAMRGAIVCGESDQADELHCQFFAAYCGTYASMEQIADSIGDLKYLESKIRRMAQVYPLGCAVRIDRDIAYARLRDAWDITEGPSGLLHVFEK